MWGALEIKESFARKSHNGIYNTHTCDQHVTFPFPIICEPSNVEFPWLEKGYGTWVPWEMPK